MRHYFLPVVAAAMFLAAASADWNDTSTGIDLRKLPHFPLTKIRSGLLQNGSRDSFDGITASYRPSPSEVLLNGVGKSGRRWEAHLCCLDEVWRGDVDRNGTQDYVFFGGGPFFNGRRTPCYSITILLMDADAMPVPFFTTVYKGEEGVRHLLDLERDGHAQLVISKYDEARSDPRAGATCSGHWVNQLYQFKNLEAQELQGIFGGIKFPLIHDWAYDDGRCFPELKPLPIEPAVLGEAGTKLAGTTIIRAINSGDGLEIDPMSGCRSLNLLDLTLVDDLGPKRIIGFPVMFSSYNRQMADRLRGTKVELRGLHHIDRAGFCGANLVWARN